MGISKINRTRSRRRVNRRTKRDKRRRRSIKKGGGFCDSILQHRDLIAPNKGDYKTKLTWFDKAIYQTCKHALSRRKYKEARYHRANRRINDALYIRNEIEDEAKRTKQRTENEEFANTKARDQLLMTKSKEKQLKQTYMKNFMDRFDRDNTQTDPEFPARRAKMFAEGTRRVNEEFKEGDYYQYTGVAPGFMGSKGGRRKYTRRR